jgi:hypothetical protein
LVCVDDRVVCEFSSGGVFVAGGCGILTPGMMVVRMAASCDECVRACVRACGCTVCVCENVVRRVCVHLCCVLACVRACLRVYGP